MAHFLDVTIVGLAGRAEPFSAALNRDVNVFFGPNGSGKTTLLKILHSAMAHDVEILRELPFVRADVKLYLKRFGQAFVRTFDQEARKVAESPSALSVKWSNIPPEPVNPETLTTYKRGYLPISRLYRNVTSVTGARRFSDKELDSAFARGLQSQWSEYYSDISNEITKAQERGFANILEFFLAGGEDQDDRAGAPDAKEAYRRISGFLNRQPGFTHLLRSERDFAAIYAKRPELRNVVKQIETVEENIAKISAPRERFRSVLESMFSGSKHLLFNEKEIQVELPEHKQIGLSLLSSGEKQLLFIALHALIGGDHCLIIDEPELSMHVDWQKRLVATLRDLNPDLQLIMATHSPEIMADLSDDKIFRI